MRAVASFSQLSNDCEDAGVRRCDMEVSGCSHAEPVKIDRVWVPILVIHSFRDVFLLLFVLYVSPCLVPTLVIRSFRDVFLFLFVVYVSLEC